ncbi:MAG: sensor histidine kinase [Dermatophilaceae bacterium]
MTDPHAQVRRGSRVPARWRVVAWLVLVTALTILVVGLVVRSALHSHVDRMANAEVAQEVDEFRIFAQAASDPESGQLYASTSDLLRTFLAGQYPGDEEMLLGFTGGDEQRVLQLDRAGDIDDAAPYPGFAADTTLVGVIRDPGAVSGVAQTRVGEMRWARVEVDGDVASDPGAALVIASFTDDRHERADDVVRMLAWVGAVCLVLTAGIAWLVAGQILRPVAQVRRVAERITENDLTRRVPVEGRDDVAALATTFNSMLDRIEAAYRTQRQFVDDAGHELRTPIAVIRGHLELVGDDPRERVETIRLVQDELDRMGRMVSDLLLLAKAEQPDFVQRTRTDLADFTMDLDAKVHALGDRRWVLEHVADGTAPLDPQRVTQAVLQLADNAIQHTESGDVIRVGSRVVDGVVRWWVADCGPGVAAEDAEVIFGRFAHGHRDQRNPGGREGAGLGLSIVRAIADAHGGSVWVASRLGEGATFGIDLPGAVPATPCGDGDGDTAAGVDGAGIDVAEAAVVAADDEPIIATVEVPMSTRGRR